MNGLLDLLSQAWRERRVLRITYVTEREEITKRDLEVYAFDVKYIDAFCRLRRDCRHFRNDRVRDAMVLPEHFQWDARVEAMVLKEGLARMDSSEQPEPELTKAPAMESPSRPSAPRSWVATVLRLVGMID